LQLLQPRQPNSLELVCVALCLGSSSPPPEQVKACAGAGGNYADDCKGHCHGNVAEGCAF
jgi:hypothetical protein